MLQIMLDDIDGCSFKELKPSMKYEVQASSLEKALHQMYEKLLAQFGEHKKFSVQLTSVDITTNCTQVFTYVFEVKGK